MIFDKTQPTKQVNYIFEAQTLRLQKHTGLWHLGVKDPDSVAEHSHLAAIIGYVLATMEKYPYPEKICTRLVFHDLHEARLGDQHKISSNYYKIPKELKARVDNEQCALINAPELAQLLHDTDDIGYAIYKDADYLEMAFTAKQYMEQGHEAAQEWISRVEEVLKTKSAKLLIKTLKKTRSTDWWKNLKEPTKNLKY